MSNLWKALRDVSREGGPTVDYESTGLGSDTESSRPVPGSEDAPQSALTHRPPAARPPRSGAPGPGASWATTEPSKEDPAPKPRLAPLQSPLRRRALSTGLPFENPKPPTNVIRPPQFGGPGPAEPGPRWLRDPADDLPVPPRAGAPWDPEPDADPTPPPVSARSSTRLPSVDPRPAPVVDPRPWLPQAIPRVQGAEPPSAPTPTLPVRRGPQGSAPATPAAPSLPPPQPTAPAEPYQRPRTSPSVALTQWAPGDDDVLPTDKRRGARPRLRDRLPW